MSDPFERTKGGRLTFKGGVVASRSKAIDKKNKKKKKKTKALTDDSEILTLGDGDGVVDGVGVGDEVDDESLYTIDAAKRMKYEELFPVETKKFGYDPNNPNTKFKSVEDALDDRVKKKADRYCIRYNATTEISGASWLCASYFPSNKFDISMP